MKVNFTQYSDQELINIIKSQGVDTEKAFAEIYDRYASRLYAYCRRIQSGREFAEDIFQETFYRFYKKITEDVSQKNFTNNLQKLDKEFSVMGFLITVTRNLCLNNQKKSKPVISIDDITSFDELNILKYNDDNSEIDEWSELTLMALEFLEPDYKEVIVLKYYVNLDYEKIAEILDATPNSIRVKAHRAKAKIKSIISRYEKKL